MAFTIPNQGQYLPQMQQPSQDIPGVQAAPMDPLLSMFMQLMTQQAPTPPPPPALKRGTRAAMWFMSPENQQRTIQNYQQADPAYRQYAAQIGQQEQRMKMAGPLASVIGAQGRMEQGAGREARLMEQFRWRQLLQSQYKRTPTNLYNPETGLNEQWIIFTDPTQNNIEVGRVPSSFSQMHYGAVAGPGGEMFQYPTSNVPPAGSAPGGGQPQGGMPQMGGAPMPQPTGTPTTGGNVSGVIPQGQGGGGAPAPPGNVRRLGVAKSAPASAVEQSTRQQKFLSGLEGAFASIDAAHAAQVQRFGASALGMIGQVAQDKIAQGRYGRAFVSKFGDPEVVDYYNKIRLSVYDYVKAQTGAQFSITEMDRYLASFPTSVDDPETAKSLIWEHANRAVREINTLKLNWQAIRIGNQQVYVSPDYLSEFLAGGGMPQIEQPEVQATDPIEQMLMRAKEKARARAPR